MLLSNIQTSISAYKKWLAGLQYHPEAYRWQSVQVFQNNWNPDTADPAVMFDRCFYNSVTKRLWQTENWYPKRMMETFWRFDPLTVRLMFDDLFNETREVEGRIGRFLFGCDELLRDYKRANPTSVENNHYHGDYRMIALYLAFRYPDTYAPYEFDTFQRAMILFGARDIPQQNDPARYFKVLRTLMTFLEKDGGVVPAMARHLDERGHYIHKTLLLAEDFCRFAAGMKYNQN